MSEASQKRYLSCISEQFPTVQSLYTEIINLKAILNLPKGTEHFMSDIHGEYDAFLHILNNCSGVVREKALLLFSSTHSAAAISDLLTLIYYPKEKLKLLGAAGRLTKGWYNGTLHDLIELSRLLSSKYTRSKVRKAMPSAYAYILDELLHALPDEDDNQLVYHQKIIDALIDIGSGDEFIVALCGLIKRLAVDRLHIVGDIYDRGPHADGIMDLLLNHHAVDIEWGNHDILWMGSAAGNPVCMAAVVRGCLQYDNMELLETGYGISLRSLALFASQNYPGLTEAQAGLQAITVILFKLEGQLIARHPEYGMEGRRLLHLLVKNSESISLSGRIYPLRPVALPTVDPADPYRLTAGEDKELALAQIRSLPSVRAAGDRVEVSMYRYAEPSWTGLVYPTDCYFPTWVLPREHAACRAAEDAYRGLFGREPRIGKWTFSTNGVAVMGMFGIPVIGFGPGRESEAHAPDEKTWKDDLAACAALYAALPALYI